MIALGTQGGLVKLVDLKRNKVISTLNIAEASSKPQEESTVFSLDWNTDGFLAVASTEELVYIKDFDPDTMSFVEDTSLTVYSQSRCVQWGPLNQKLLAAGLFNGNIVVFDMDKAEVKQLL